MDPNARRDVLFGGCIRADAATCIARVKPTTAYFVAVYTGITVVGIKPAMDPTLPL